MNKYLLLGISILLNAPALHGQETYNDKVKKYVSQYYPLAIAEQRISGIPACVTLGQGILETQAGASDLVSGANNHFGIKCANGWQGETYSHDDETKNECFKKYNNAAESFKDHSDHLKRNPRYAPLFSLSATDYAGWAVCLKKCGYATNPQYAQQLIKIIEDFKLQEYTYSALDSSLLNKYPMTAGASNAEVDDALPDAAAPASRKTMTATAAITKAKPGKTAATVAAPAMETPPPPSDDATNAVAAVADGQDTTVSWDINSAIDSSKIVEMNGMKAVYVNKGEMLLPYAVKYHIRYPRLLEMNDLPDGPAPFTMYVYLEKKLTYGQVENHTVADGETLLMVSQAEGVQLKKIMALNMLNPNEEPVAGSILELQNPAAKKPEVRIVETIAHKENAIVTAGTADPRPAGDYIAIKRARPAEPEKKKTTTPTAATTKEATPKNDVAAKVAALDKRMAREEQNEEDTTEEEDLSGLKADLDKVVYTDDSKLVKNHAKNTAAQPADGAFYTIKKGDNISVIARKNNVTVKQLLKWNHIEPDAIKAGDKLRVAPPAGNEVAEAAEPKPVHKSQPAPVAAAEPAQAAAGATRYHTIQKGETLSAIAVKNHITVKQLLAWNEITGDKIKDGQKLRVTDPAADAPAEEPAAPVPAPTRKAANAATTEEGKYHIVKKGETVGGIAARNDVTVKQLLKWNHVSADKIREGQKLVLSEPGSDEEEEDSRPAKNEGVNGKYYVIKKGETLGGIAARNHVTVKQILKWNDIQADKIKDGQKLRVKE